MTKWISIGSGAYQERRVTAQGRLGKPTGAYRARPMVNGRRTWRGLVATEKDAAKREAAAQEWRPLGESLSGLATLYMSAGCPTRKHSWQRGSDSFIDAEERHIKQLNRFFGKKSFADATPLAATEYFAFRTHGAPAGRLTRAVDKELQTLVNIKSYAVFSDAKRFPYNDLLHHRPRFHNTKTHARDRMPESAAVIHALADAFLRRAESEVFAWLTWFSMFTGCRQSELLRLRVDAAEQESGFVRRTAAFDVPDHRGIYRAVGYLDLGRRSKVVSDALRKKDGLNPECPLWPEFAQMLDCFQRWHQQRYPDCEYYFPGATGAGPVDECSFNHALTRECRRQNLKHITPHGFRSYFATKLHRDGFADEDIAAAIGDKTVAVVQNTYRDRRSGERLSWLPPEGLPGWLLFAKAETKVIAFPRGKG